MAPSQNRVMEDNMRLRNSLGTPTAYRDDRLPNQALTFLLFFSLSATGTREYRPDQAFLLPPSLRDWLPEGHLAYFVSEVVETMDLSEILAHYEKEERGQPPYHPRMMVKVLLYGYCRGVRSSRKIAQRLEEDVAFKVLAANNCPDFRTISDFRRIHLERLKKLFVQVLRLCQEAGLVKLGYVALDGTKVNANASKHKAMS